MFSEEEIRKILRLREVNIGKIEIETENTYLQNLLTFANVGNPTCKELDKPLNEINFLDFFTNLDYSFTSLPKETPASVGYMTIEKYKKVVEKIIQKLEKKEEVIIHDILVELNYHNLGSAIYLDGFKEK